MRIRLERVRFMPKELVPGVLYVSEEFRTAAHLCACGCGSKVRTPLGPAEWMLEECEAGPSLRPSIGNWQNACRSHYWILEGEVVWSKVWTREQIATGRRREKERRGEYYQTLQRAGILERLWQWLVNFFR